MNTDCKISKYADNMKIISRAMTTAVKMQLQFNLNILVSWSKKRQTKFNVDKWHILHIGNNNHHTNYTLNGSKLSKTTHEKDLGITVNKNFKPSKHCSDVVKNLKKNSRLHRKNKYKSEESHLTLFNVPVDPIL